MKTRLARELGATRAADVYRCLLETTLSRFHDPDRPESTGRRHVLAFWPPPRHAEFTALAPGWTLQPQADGDLGQRMEQFFQAALDAGVERVVLLGSDAPDVPRSWIERAFERLRSHEVVLGPAEDGGYYLLGVAGALPGIFRDIPWSTSDVCRATLDQLAASACRWTQLPLWHDVDTLGDLQSLCGRLAATREPQLAGLRDALADLLADRR